MQEDIAPELYAKIAKDFNKSVKSDKEIKKLIDKIRSGKATQKEVSKYTYLLGKCASGALSKHIRLQDLPNETLYWNIAERTIQPVLQETYNSVNYQAMIQQRLLDRSQGIRAVIRKGQDPANRIRGVMNAACAAKSEEALHKVMTDNVITTSRAFYDDFQEANMNERSALGFEPKVIREYDGIGLHGGKETCQFCMDRAGEWTMEEARANGVFQRHEGCGCTIEVVYPDHTYRQIDWKHNRWTNSGNESSIKTKQNVEYNMQTKPHQEDGFETAIEACKLDEVEYKAVNILDCPLTDDEIIMKIGGGDMTKGSCQSLALAYAGNKVGYDVRDFRGGISLDIFSHFGTIKRIAKTKGVTGFIVSDLNGYKSAAKALTLMKPNKEYILSTGKHAAIVKRAEGSIQFLELQDPETNGFFGLTNGLLKKRFGVTKQRTIYGIKVEQESALIDIDTLKGNNSFKEMLGYINTDVGKELKGVRGSVK